MRDLRWIGNDIIVLFLFVCDVILCVVMKVPYSSGSVADGRLRPKYLSLGNKRNNMEC